MKKKADYKSGLFYLFFGFLNDKVLAKMKEKIKACRMKCIDV